MRERILIIEDEADMRFVLTDNLQAEGYEVEAVAYTHLTLPTIYSV